jgi:glucose/arabinose dehydrogenase
MNRTQLTLAAVAGVLAACGGTESGTATAAEARTFGDAFVATPIAKFDEPWAMTFLPDGRLLVTEKKGTLRVLKIGGTAGDVSGVPKVDYGGQGGFGDVILHPGYASNGIIYLSYVEAGENDTRGAVVARAKLTLDDKGGGALSDVKTLWSQVPKVTGRGHYGHRMAFGPDGKLWITSGERQKFDPAQDMNSNLGKIVRLNDDGSVPADNPFADKGGVTAQIWSLGHRNLLGIDFDAQGRPWNQEMGPKGGDELNLVKRGANYGYPVVSNGDHYDGKPIPDHPTRPEFEAPKVFWNPVISPAGLLIYDGALFPKWQGDAFIGGLSSKALVRIEIDGDQAREAERYDMGVRIREVEQGPDGAIWLLEDERNGEGGRLLKLTPPT